jgi:WhiB family transcriptional regulator, redox-sensing transcriptional regulator
MRGEEADRGGSGVARHGEASSTMGPAKNGQGQDDGCLPAARLAARLPGVIPGHDLRCTDHPELFFAESPDEMEAAKALCRECPARTACLAGALERREPWGVWGGEVFLDGAIVSRKRPRGRPRKTDAAARELGVRGNELPPRPAGLRAFVSGFERNPRTSPPRWPTAGCAPSSALHGRTETYRHRFGQQAHHETPNVSER